MKTEAIERCLTFVKLFEDEIDKHRKSGPSIGEWVDRATEELRLIKEAQTNAQHGRPGSEASPKPCALSCEGCNRFRKNKQWGLGCMDCVRNPKFTDNFEKRTASGLPG